MHNEYTVHCGHTIRLYRKAGVSCCQIGDGPSHRLPGQLRDSVNPLHERIQLKRYAHILYHLFAGDALCDEPLIWLHDESTHNVSPDGQSCGSLPDSPPSIPEPVPSQS